MTSGDVMDGCASAGRNEDRGSVRKKRFQETFRGAQRSNFVRTSRIVSRPVSAVWMGHRCC